MRASVVIVNFNSGEYLDRCLRSVLSGTEGAEIILVDNASSDGSADQVARSFAEVIVIRSASNGGFGSGCNLGVEASRGHYLAFLNPDTVVQPGWLDELIAALDADPTVGLATAKVLLMSDPEHINTCGNDVHFTGLTLCRGKGLASRTCTVGVEVAAVSGAAFAIPRELFRCLGGFDQELFLYLEDTDLSLRARLMGFRCVFVPNAVVYHDYALRFGPQKVYYQERNRYIMLLKAYRWRTWLLLWPSLLLAEVVTWGFVLTHEPRRWGNKVRAYGWVVGHWRHMVASHVKTQATRRVSDRELLAVCTARLDYAQVAEGLVARLAHAVLDPLFLAMHRLLVLVVRW